ncbi:MAG: hypothetical protein WEA09_13810 [Gemmatimonadota bacterium]
MKPLRVSERLPVIRWPLGRLGSRLGFTVALVFGLAPLAASGLEGQQISLDVRGGLTAPFGDLSGGSNASQGFSGQGAIHMRVAPQLGIYAGGSYHTFVCNPVTCGGDLNSRGGEIGVRFSFPPSGSLTPWARGGLMVHRARWSAPVSRLEGVELPDDPMGEAFLESDWEPGFELGAGLDFQVRRNAVFSLSARQYRYSTQFVRSVLPPLERTFSYMLVDVGIRVLLSGR